MPVTPAFKEGWQVDHKFEGLSPKRTNKQTNEWGNKINKQRQIWEYTFTMWIVKIFLITDFFLKVEINYSSGKRIKTTVSVACLWSGYLTSEGLPLSHVFQYPSLWLELKYYLFSRPIQWLTKPVSVAPEVTTCQHVGQEEDTFCKSIQRAVRAGMTWELRMSVCLGKGDRMDRFQHWKFPVHSGISPVNHQTACKLIEWEEKPCAVSTASRCSWLLPPSLSGAPNLSIHLPSPAQQKWWHY